MIMRKEFNRIGRALGYENMSENEKYIAERFWQRACEEMKQGWICCYHCGKSFLIEKRNDEVKK